jgi:hypothetical protein
LIKVEVEVKVKWRESIGVRLLLAYSIRTGPRSGGLPERKHD